MVTKYYRHLYICKLKSADKKITLKAIILGIRMCSSRLLYDKQESIADIFLRVQVFFGQPISQNSSKPLIEKGFYLLRMSDDYCFRRAAHRQLSQRNRRNTATVLIAVVKSHNYLK